MIDIKNMNNCNHYKDYVVKNGKHYYVSTAYMCNNWETTWETRVFPCTKNNKVVDWRGKSINWYVDEAEAVKGHKYIVENLEKYI